MGSKSNGKAAVQTVVAAFVAEAAGTGITTPGRLRDQCGGLAQRAIAEGIPIEAICDAAREAARRGNFSGWSNWLMDLQASRPIGVPAVARAAAEPKGFAGLRDYMRRAER